MIRDIVSQNVALALALGGLLIGFVFGAVVYRTNYCAMGSLSDIFNFNDYRRFRAWVLAAATALIGATLLEAAGVVDLARSMYLAPTLNWVGHIGGGLIFGIGMVLAGGCPSRNLARAGGGDLRALMTLMVLGLVAFMTIAGILAPVRATLEGATSVALERCADPGPRRPSERARRHRARLGQARRCGPRSRGRARLLLRRCQVPQIAAAHPLRCRRRPHGRRRLGADRPRLRRHGGSPHAADLAHLHPPRRATRCSGSRSTRPRRCRASAWRACSAHCSAHSQRRSPWAGSVSPPSPTQATRCVT